MPTPPPQSSRQLDELVDGRYRIDRVLGTGAMGVVYLAHDVGLDRPTALKTLHPSVMRNLGFAERFHAEARALASVRSEHVVRAYAIGEMSNGSAFLAMEYIAGTDLEELLDRYATKHESVPVDRAIAIIRQVAIGLEAVHALGLIHRDIKPSNIVIEQGTGRPVLVDFGLARRASQDGAMTVAAGTPQFMAPEQASGAMIVDAAALVPATDVYALGCTAYYLLTGEPPFSGNDVVSLVHAHHTANIPSLAAQRPDAAAYDAILSRTMAKRPEDRFTTMADFIRALDAVSRPASNHGTRSKAERSKRVLLVDSDPDFRRFARTAIELACEEEGASVTIFEAEDGEGAIEVFAREAPNWLVIEQSLPSLSGLDALSTIRSLPGGIEPRVIALTADPPETIAHRAGNLRVNRLIGKPILLPAFVDILRKTMSGGKRPALPVAV